jgi:hypothetical protein
VCQGLAGGSRVIGGMTGSSELGHLCRGLCGLIHDVLGDGAWKKVEQVSFCVVRGRQGSATVGDDVESSHDVYQAAIVSRFARRRAPAGGLEIKHWKGIVSKTS